jgi:hypothetical protein
MALVDARTYALEGEGLQLAWGEQQKGLQTAKAALGCPAAFCSRKYIYIFI